MFDTRNATRYMTKVGVLSALAAVVMMLESPLPFLPPFLKIDLSEIPVLLATFALGPIAGVLVELIKNLIHLPFSSTMGIGEIANFLVGCAYIIPAGIVYSRMKNRSGAVLSMAVGVASMAVFASLFNYFILIPLYAAVLHFPADAIVSMGTKVNPGIVDLKTLIAYAIVPFNLFKGIVVSLLVMLVYKRVSPLLHSKARIGTEAKGL